MAEYAAMTCLSEPARKWAIAMHLKEFREGIRGYREVECEPLQAFLAQRAIRRRSGGDRRFRRL